MRIDREKFLTILEMVKPGLSQREFLEQSSCYVFQDGKVMTFNDEIACRMDIPIKITGAIQAVTLLDILSKLDDPVLKVRENDKGELEFRGKKKGFGVNKDAEIFLPINQVEMPTKWHPLPKEFTEAVGLVQNCVSSDESRFLLTCIHVHPDYVEACDNLQIMRYQMKMGLKSPILMRGTSIKYITSLAMDEVAITKAWTHFRNQAGLIFSCRKYVEDYPPLDRLVELDGHPITIPKGVKDASERAAVFASDKSGDPLAMVSISSDAIRIRGEGLSGWYEESKSINYEGPPLRFSISPDLLRYISDQYSEAHISPDRLKVSGNRWEYVTVLGTTEKAEVESPEPKKKRKKKKDEE